MTCGIKIIKNRFLFKTALRKKVEPKGAVSWYVTHLHPWHYFVAMALLHYTTWSSIESSVTDNRMALLGKPFFFSQ